MFHPTTTMTESKPSTVPLARMWQAILPTLSNADASTHRGSVLPWIAPIQTIAGSASVTPNGKLTLTRTIVTISS